MKRQCAGYLLIELACVIALLAFLAGLCVHVSGALDRLQLRADAEKMVAFLRHAWLHASRIQKIIKLRVSIKDNALYEENAQTFKLSRNIIFGVPKRALGPPSRPTRPIKEPCTFVDNQITFYPDGTASAGALYITDRHKTIAYAVTIPLPDIFQIHLYVRSRGSWKRL